MQTSLKYTDKAKLVSKDFTDFNITYQACFAGLYHIVSPSHNRNAQFPQNFSENKNDIISDLHK